MKARLTTVLLAIVLSGAAAGAQQAQQVPSWEAWKFLIGHWVGEEGGGAPGQSTSGEAWFKLDLQGRVLIRTDHSEYPANKDHPAFAHDGLMIIWAEPGGRVRADYWDNEGHVIRYTATSDGKTATFVSDEAPQQPRYRLTYTQTAPDHVTVKFEIAPPGKAEQFQMYVQGKTRRK